MITYRLLATLRRGSGGIAVMGDSATQLKGIHMRRSTAAVMAVALVGATVFSTQTQAPAASAATVPDSVVASYFADWDTYSRGYNVVDIPADKVNVLIYAFGKPKIDTSNGAVGCDSYDHWADWQSPNMPDLGPNAAIDARNIGGHFEQLLKLKAEHPQLRVLISLGGWTLSEGFSQAAATAAKRQAFVASCLDMFIKGNLPVEWPGAYGGQGVAAGLFDGIDVDWEYPGQVGDPGVTWSTADKHNYTLLMQEFRNQLNALGTANNTRYLLTGAVAAAKNRVDAGYEVPQIAALMDLVFAMTYDFHGPFDPIQKTDLNSPFKYDPQSPMADSTLSTKAAINYWLSKGVPASKLVMGIPFHGRQYANVQATNNGLYQPYDNTGFGTDPNEIAWDKTLTPTYHDLVDVAQIVTPTEQAKKGFIRDWNYVSDSPWLYNPTSKRFISYDDAGSVEEKTDWAIEKDLRGVFSWKISDDSNAHELLDAMGPMLP